MMNTCNVVIGVSISRVEEFLLAEEVQGQVRGGGHIGALV